MLTELRTPQNPDKIRKMAVQHLLDAESCCLKTHERLVKGQLCRACSRHAHVWIVSMRWLLYAENPTFAHEVGREKAKLYATKITSDSVSVVFVFDEKPGELFFVDIDRVDFPMILMK